MNFSTMNVEELTAENKRLRSTVVSLMSDKSKLCKLNKKYRVEIVRAKKETLMNNIKLTKRNVKLLKTNATMQNKMNEMQKQLESNSTMENKMKQMQKQLDDILDVNLKCSITSKSDDENFDDDDVHCIEDDEFFIDDHMKEIIEQEIYEKKNKHDDIIDKGNVVTVVEEEIEKSSSLECDCPGNPKTSNSSSKSSDGVIDKKNDVVNSDRIDEEESDEPPSPKKIRRSRRNRSAVKRRSVRIRSTRNKK